MVGRSVQGYSGNRSTQHKVPVFKSKQEESEGSVIVVFRRSIFFLYPIRISARAHFYSGRLPAFWLVLDLGAIRVLHSFCLVRGTSEGNIKTNSFRNLPALGFSYTGYHGVLKFLTGISKLSDTGEDPIVAKICI